MYLFFGQGQGQGQEQWRRATDDGDDPGAETSEPIAAEAATATAAGTERNQPACYVEDGSFCGGAGGGLFGCNGHGSSRQHEAKRKRMAASNWRRNSRQGWEGLLAANCARQLEV